MSAVVQSARRSRRGFDLRAFVAGGAATAALIAAVVLVFGSLAAYVGFNGSPIGGSDASESSEVVVETGARAPALAAAAASGASRAVAAEPAAATAVAPPPGAVTDSGAGTGAAADSAVPTEAGLAPTGGESLPAPPGTTIPTTSSPEGEESVSPTSPTSPTTASGPVGNAVEGVDDTTGLSLGQTTEPVTNPLDQVVGGLGSTVQGVNDTVNNVTGGLLNP